MVLLPYFLNEGTWIFFLHQSPDYVTGLDLIWRIVTTVPENWRGKKGNKEWRQHREEVEIIKI